MASAKTPNQLGIQPNPSPAAPSRSHKAKKEHGKLKLDQGFKSVLRGIRKAIRTAFDETGLQTGKHHWHESKWVEKSRDFLEEYLGFSHASDYEIAAMILLLYHSFGPSKAKEVDKESFVYIHL
jgi:hypothetical protein